MTIETHTEWGRDFTPDEMVLLSDRKAKLIAEGVVYGPMIVLGNVQIREWATEELANDWIAFANSLNPPPLKAELVITDD